MRIEHRRSRLFSDYEIIDKCTMNELINEIIDKCTMNELINEIIDKCTMNELINEIIDEYTIVVLYYYKSIPVVCVAAIKRSLPSTSVYSGQTRPYI